MKALAIRFLAVVCLSAAAAGIVALQAQQRHGRLFPPQDLGVLEGPDRDAWQKPEQVMDALGIADGAVVADLGAGGGWFTVRLARRVGPNGLVYAEDIQRQMIEAIERRVQREGLDNVRTILGTPVDPRLPEGQIDAVLIVEAYHEMEQPVLLLRNVRKALKPKGRLGIVEFKPGGGGPGPDANERVAPEQIIESARAAGLELVSRETFLRFQNLLVFSPGAAASSETTKGTEMAAKRMRAADPRSAR
jgi:SAM-dependent methyltransferase